MKDFTNVSWTTAIILLVVGAAMTAVSFKYYSISEEDRKDIFGVWLSERFLFVALNGMTLLLMGLLISVLKLTQDS